MIYIGNYSNYIQQEWIDFIMSNDGTRRPGGGRNPNVEEFQNASKSGYDLTQTYWYIYESDTFPFTINPPITVSNVFIWWFIKMLPGNIMPMHKDPHAVNEQNSKRYWMALQDYEPGHIFIYNKELLTDYKKGDIYMYDDSRELHGACNIGYVPRLVFNFSTYDIKKENI